jgi:SPP1 gp7 family putative phage head morphogenesis protein
MELNDKYNHQYLRTEYNQAVQAAQMASKWADFERDKEFINLQYRTANDERVRASHRVLHGVTLPVDDKFWQQYTPPNGWGCRCTVVAVPKDDPDFPVRDAQGSTINGKEVFPTPAYEIFKTNTAKDQKLFPDKHPYLPKGFGNCKYKSLVFNDVKAICKACRKVDAASARWSNDVTKTHYRNIIKENERQKWMVDNGPVKDITVTRSNIELLIWKPHKRYFAKNMAIYYLKQLMQDKNQVVFIGSSKDIKGDSRNGHTNETVWYYYKMKFLGGYSYIVVKEYNGERIVHMIQDEDHFDESKIKNKA